MCSINPAQSFHNSRQKKGEVQTHSAFPYPCLILTYWRMISKVRNCIVSYSPLVQMYYCFLPIVLLLSDHVYKNVQSFVTILKLD